MIRARPPVAAAALAASLAVLACAAPGCARAGEFGLQPFVGSTVLDPRLDLPALGRAMGLSLAIQAGRQGSSVAAALWAADAVETGVIAAGIDDPGLAAAAGRSVRTHRAVAALSVAGFGVRTLGAALTWTARTTLARGLLGWTFPVLAGGALDLTVTALEMIAGLRLRAARRAAGVMAGEVSRASLRGEQVPFLTAAVAAVSAVTQILVGTAAADLAIYEARRERATVALALAIGGASLRVRF